MAAFVILGRRIRYGLVALQEWLSVRTYTFLLPRPRPQPANDTPASLQSNAVD
jgi:hypothetical protein